MENVGLLGGSRWEPGLESSKREVKNTGVYSRRDTADGIRSGMERVYIFR